jgi:hypothetical protein
MRCSDCNKKCKDKPTYFKKKDMENIYNNYKPAKYGSSQHIVDTDNTYGNIYNSTKVIRVNKRGLFLNILESLR